MKTFLRKERTKQRRLRWFAALSFKNKGKAAMKYKGVTTVIIFDRFIKKLSFQTATA